MTDFTALVACVLCAAAPLGCIKAPEIVMVDRATALEQQASGSFGDLEKKLSRVSIAPRPVPFTPAELEALGIGATPLVDSAGRTEADEVDALLLQHCIGEGHEGLLVDTHEHCHGAVDGEEAALLVDRVNRARTQLWKWMQEQRPGAAVDDLRRSWHAIHARGVTCGAWVEGDDGKWEGKQC